MLLKCSVRNVRLFLTGSLTAPPPPCSSRRFVPGGRQLDTGHRQGDAPRSESPFLGSIVTGPRLLGQTFLQRGRELERLFRLEVLAVLVGNLRSGSVTD